MIIHSSQRIPYHLSLKKFKKTLKNFETQRRQIKTYSCLLIMIFSCYEIKNKQKRNGLGRQRMSDDLMELNDMELNYIYFGGETDSNDSSNNLDEDFAL